MVQEQIHIEEQYFGSSTADSASTAGVIRRRQPQQQLVIEG